MSKKSLTKSTKITGTSDHVSASSRLSGFSASPIVEKSLESGNLKTLLGPSSTPKIRPSAVETRMPTRIAPLNPRAVRMIITSSPAERDQRRAAGQDAEADPRRRVVDRDARVAEADERDEQPDADADRELDLLRDRAHDRLAQPGDDEHERDHALDHDARHRDRPRQVPAEDQVEGDDRVEPEPGGERERQVRQQAHQQREDRRGERGGDRDRRERHPGRRQDRRVDEDDVRHRQERHEAAEDLDPHGRPALVDREASFERAEQPCAGRYTADPAAENVRPCRRQTAV